MGIALGLLVALALAAAVVAVLAHRIEPFLRDRIVAELQQRFHGRVELDSFHLSIKDGLQAEGSGLRIWLPAQAALPAQPVTDKPRAARLASGAVAQEPNSSANAQIAQPLRPIIELARFHFRAPLRFQPGKPFHIRFVVLEGLAIDLPPRSHFIHGTAHATRPADAMVPSEIKIGNNLITLLVDNIECAQARLTLETSKPGKLPLDFEIASLKLADIKPDGTAGFDTQLTIPTPRGSVHSTGTIGPWQFDDPGESPIEGAYTLTHADLATFAGIEGNLDSTGNYKGTLRDLTVDGQAQVPDFRLTHFGNALPLAARFHAHVDATNGDTVLDPVDATLGRSHFTAKGPIVRVVPAGASQSIGHDIDLNIDVDRARIEDFLRLATHSEMPLLTGSVAVKARFHLPPGPEPVHERMRLEGAFILDHALFTSPKIQSRVEELSLRGQGRPGEVKSTDPNAIQSQMRGDVHIAGGVVSLPALVFDVPGAQIRVSGTYGLDGGALDFAGTANMQATVSKMVGGWKGFLLKPVDRFLKKDGAGTRVPIRITGTREQPEFGVDFGGKTIQP